MMPRTGTVSGRVSAGLASMGARGDEARNIRRIHPTRSTMQHKTTHSADHRPGIWWTTDGRGGVYAVDLQGNRVDMDQVEPRTFAGFRRP